MPFWINQVGYYMRSIVATPALAAGMTVAAVTQPLLTTHAFGQEVLTTDCDRYAASEVDPQRKAPGVPFKKLDALLAVPACESAVRQYPDSIRLNYQLGRAYKKAGNFQAAMQQYRKAAEQGSALAQTDLGNLHFQGQGVPKDYLRAITLWRKAADQGAAEAQYNLGYMYRHGLGLPQDYQQAFDWFQKSADQGWGQAETSLGFMYATGLGVPQDHKQALVWYRKAADQGIAAAQHSLGLSYEHGWGVTQDLEQALTWYEKAAEQGYEQSIAKVAERRAQEGRAAQVAQDGARGYQTISIETFVLDGRELASKAAMVSISGTYIRRGNLDFLYVNATALALEDRFGRQQPNVPLLTDDASREFRRYLLACQSGRPSWLGCPVTVLGRVTTCIKSNAFGTRREEPCVAVEDGRQ
jgi:TPR repeat protein